MKPPIEYRPKQVRISVAKPKQPGFTEVKKLEPIGLVPDNKPITGEFIVIRRDRAKYNAYMRAYRAKKKTQQVP